MKTVWDAVSELKGDFNLDGLDTEEYFNQVICTNCAFDGYSSGFVTTGSGVKDNKYWTVICTKEEFNELVLEMENNFYKYNMNGVTNYQIALAEGTVTKLEVESKVDYKSEEFWKDAPEWAKELGTKNGVMNYWMDDVSYQLCLHDKNARVFFSNYDSSDKLSFLNVATRPQPKPVYTQEMADKGELPSVGMEVLVRGCKRVILLGPDSDGDYVTTNEHGAYDFDSADQLKPIDTRTKKEKAIDGIRLSCGFNKLNSMEKELLAKAYDTWSKGNE